MEPPKLTLVPDEKDVEAENVDLGPATKKKKSPQPKRGKVERDDNANITSLPSADRGTSLRILEALLFAASEPMNEARLAQHLPDGSDVRSLLDELKGFYAGRGIRLVRTAGRWSFRTAEDLAYLLEQYATEERKLSKAALETLAIIAYHQPATRAEIEEIRGVSTSTGTLDILLETNWIKIRGRRRAPGRPVTYGTTEVFLDHFGLESIKDLPGLNELKGAGLLQNALPSSFQVPEPTDVAELMPDELPFDADTDENDIETGPADETDDLLSDLLEDEETVRPAPKQND